MHRHSDIMTMFMLVFCWIACLTLVKAQETTTDASIAEDSSMVPDTDVYLGVYNRETSHRTWIELQTKPNIPPQELEALYDLYNATNGQHWLWLNASYDGVPWVFNATSNPCSQRWQGVSCTGAPIGGYLNVMGLDLYQRNLQGTLPSSIGNFSEMKGLDLAENLLSGTMPETMSMLHNLLLLNLGTNHLNGTIPEKFSELTKLQVIYLNENKLTGTLPDLFGTLQHLNSLLLYQNKFYGTIPESYCLLPSLTVLNLGTNDLLGTIPDDIGLLTGLTTLALNSNYFHGTIPESMGNLVNLMYVYLDYNGFYGTIPPFIGNFTSLLYLSMNENFFSGTIPHSIAQLDGLQNIYLHTNKLTGTIPWEFGQMQLLILLDFHHNKLTGTIPPEFGGITLLEVLNLYTNFLTGEVPATLAQLTELQNLDFSQNYLSGTFPAELGTMTALVSMKIHETQLTGSVPETIAGMTSLGYLSLHDNHLTGTIPHSVSQMQMLNSFFMFNNLFTGPVSGFINATMQVNLAIIQVSGNQLTGQLPDELFLLPQLQTLAVVSNCFHGTIPTSACNSTTIKTLSLDGLRSGSSCQDVILPGMSDTYVLSSHFTQGVPTCLFEIPSLNTLHLSGNGLTGRLPNDVQISPNLVDISLSHNKLTGTIPRIFQERIWYNFDLSYNKFKGTLTKAFATVPGNLTVLDYLGLEVVSTNPTEYFIPRAALSLRNNRLSHVIPQVVQDMLNVSVLQGNLFGCLLDESDLPAHDDGKDTYQCGSNSFNISYYIFVATLGVIVTLAATMYFWRNEILAYIDLLTVRRKVRQWLGVIDWYDKDTDRARSRLHRYKYFVLLCRVMCEMAMACTAFILVILLPVYCLLSNYYGSHTFEYAWAVSGAFLSGYVSLSLLLICYFFLMLVVLYLFREAFRTMRSFLFNLPKDHHFSVEELNREEEEERLLKENRFTSEYEKAIVYVAFFLLNVTVVAGVNTAYVYAVIYANSTYITLAQVALSVFKLIWNNFGSIYLIRWTHHQLASSSTKDWKSKSASFFAIQLFVALFNYILVPCIVVAAVSPNCFNNVMVAAPPVSAYFYYDSCSLYSALFGCLAYEPLVASTTYNPPFTYSYECSSSLITYYSPTFVYLGFIVTFVSPAWDFILQQLHQHAPRGTYFFAVLDFWVVPVLHYTTVETAANDPPYDIFNPYIDANLLMVTICCYLGVLLTFGALFPPIAVVMCLSIMSIVCVSRIEVGRFMYNAIALNIHKYTDIIESECQGVGSIPKLRQCVRLLVTFCCLFYTPFLFDTLGDAKGVKTAYWICIVGIMLPAVFYVGHRLYVQGRRRMYGDGTPHTSITSVEMRPSQFLKSKRAEDLLQAAMDEESVSSSEYTNPYSMHSLHSIHSVNSTQSMSEQRVPVVRSSGITALPSANAAAVSAGRDADDENTTFNALRQI